METNDTPLTERFRSAYWQSVRHSDVVRLRQWEQWQVTLPQLRVLSEIRRSPGVTTGELARILGVTVSTTSGLVIKLADRRLIGRSACPGDRRQQALALSAEGEALLGEMRGPSVAFLDEVIRELGPDLERATVTMERLAQATQTARDAFPAPEQRREAVVVAS